MFPAFFGELFGSVEEEAAIEGLSEELLSFFLSSFYRV
jgi:hypothetical protein